jgi:ethanolaminephosphotransferase
VSPLFFPFLQARRTGASSPLGLLFDHGIDALNTTFANFVVMAVFQTGVSYTSLWLWVVAYVAFVAATWEEFFVGKLTLGIVNGPSDGLMMSVIMFLLSARQPGMWATAIGDTAWLRALLGDASPLLTWRLHWVPLSFVSIGLIPTVLDSTWTVYRKGFQRSWWTPLAKLFPFAQHLSLVALWAVYSPSRIFDSHPRLMMLANCFLFCNMICKLMLAHLCDVDFKAARASTLPLTLAVASSLLPAVVPGALPVVAEETALYLVAAAHFALYGHFVFHVINEITDALNIRCFVITEAQKAAQRAKEEREAAAARLAAAGVEAASEATTRRRRRPSSNA